ncbi:hypothetical protein VZ95_14550 [Elstera litoralis]|uniref:Uncharacterized protein n=1 Tax=Elstera litoralis TaxID=552518 RepID=A0A0F3IQW2_9PROT|nr:hypothetical protein [Elstera litoralis]KJV08943.1 hypothetical protein VZ95_14550 [Elstera litoralis]
MPRLSIVLTAAVLTLAATATLAQTPLPNGVPSLPKVAAPKVETPKLGTPAPKADVSTAAKAAALTKALPGQSFTDLALAEKRLRRQEFGRLAQPQFRQILRAGQPLFRQNQRRCLCLRGRGGKVGFHRREE